MADPFVAVIVGVPDEHFTVDDDICLGAGNYVCSRLEKHLKESGHEIPNWICGGCNEDWGVYFESIHDDEVFQFHICFYPESSKDGKSLMIVQYHLKISFLRRLFSKSSELAVDHDMHGTMKNFADLFEISRMVTQSQFDKEY